MLGIFLAGIDAFPGFPLPFRLTPGQKQALKEIVG